MKEIDFLPAAYREKNAANQARLCQIAMVLSFGAVVTLAACLQFALYRSAQTELTSIEGQHQDAIAKTAELAALRAEVDQQNQICELYTYLKYPWPRTQMLAEIASNLPEQVTLNELTIVEEMQKAGVRTSVISVDLATQQATDETPAKKDLQSLRSEQDRSRAEIQISGITSDSAKLHDFVMKLNGISLFESVKLHSMEAVSDSESQSKFYVRLRVRAGYGQSGGPLSPTANQHQFASSQDRS